MMAPDVNVLLYAFREESERHADYRRWMQAALSGPEPVGLFEPVLAAVVRIATHPSRRQWARQPHHLARVPGFPAT